MKAEEKKFNDMPTAAAIAGVIATGFAVPQVTIPILILGGIIGWVIGRTIS